MDLEECDRGRWTGTFDAEREDSTKSWVDGRSEIQCVARFHQISHATCRSDAVATAVANRVIANADGKNGGLRANSPARSRGNTPQPGSNNLAVKNSPRSVRGGTPASNPNPTLPTKMVADTVDVKPSTAVLQAADRLNSAVTQLREGSTDSINSAGVKRKADEDVDSHKELKREKA
jgi:hypothetical protein